MAKDGGSLSRQREEMSLFDQKPIELGGFKLNGSGIEAVGRPKLAQWCAAMEFAIGAEKASPFWVGALWNYAEKRHDWEDQLEQALADMNRPLVRKTLINLGYIASNVHPKAQKLAPSIGHADVVQDLDPAEQIEWMEKAKSEELTVRELRLEVKASRRRKIIEGQAVLEGMFRVIYADPPWDYGNRPPSGHGVRETFPPMEIADICALPVGAHALPNSVLFMWVTAPTCLQNPGPREVGEAWGFEYKQQFVWDKVDGTFSHYTGGNHEILTIWTRGSGTPDVPTGLADSVQTIRKSRTHSEKPEDFRRIIEKHWTSGPYLELFASKPAEGWTVFGNDARLWAAEAERQSA